jgi:PiT family inorganic phosphate transporter
VIETASRFGFPLSTTHTISSTILGVGAGRRMNSVRWDVVGNMVRAWVLTIPITALIGYLAFLLLNPFLR